MIRIQLLFSIVLFSTILMAQGNDDYVKNELIIQFKTGVDLKLNDETSISKVGVPVIDELNIKYQVETIKSIKIRANSDAFQLVFKTNQDIKKLGDVYMSTGLFEYVEPNYIGYGGGIQHRAFKTTPYDQYFDRQWGLYNDGSFTKTMSSPDADIDMDEAWDIEHGDSTVIVAILDSGLKMNHPEFEDRIWTNREERNNQDDSDKNNYIDDIMGWDFVQSDNDPTDDNGHGTNIATIIGANADNEVGYAGVDWNCKLMICKIIDENNTGTYLQWSEAIYYAVDHGARVINMSVGGRADSRLLKEAVDYAYNNGVVVVASMMNTNNAVEYYPATYPKTIAVGATNSLDERSSSFLNDKLSGSNYGDHIDVVAPGNYIYGLSHLSDTDYDQYWAGTSQATALVSGLSSLLIAQYNDRTPDEIRALITEHAEDQIGSSNEDIEGFDRYYGHGRINAYESLSDIYMVDFGREEMIDKIHLFPNPGYGRFHIEEHPKLKSIQVVGPNGAIVYVEEKKVKDQEWIVDLSFFNAATYTIHFLNERNESFESKKLIIEK